MKRVARLDMSQDQDVDDLVRLAALLLNAPTAGVGLIAAGREWLKAEIGLGRREIPLGASFCVHALPHRDGLVIPDLTIDPRFMDNPIVTGGGLRFYAGVPLRTSEGLPVGALFVLDTEPRPEGLSAREYFILKTLAHQAINQIERPALLRERSDTSRMKRDFADRERMWRLSTDIMMVLGPGYVIKAVNPASTALLGWSEAELLGSHAMALLHPDDEAIARLQVPAEADRARTRKSGQRGGEAVRDRSPRCFEGRIRHRDGTYRWIRWTAVSEAGSLHALGRDVSAEKEQAEALRQAGDELRQSRKMEAVGQMTGGLAHDFNNLLTGISGSLDLLQVRASQGRIGELDRYVTAAQDAAGRAASLTQRLLAFSRRQTLEPKPTRVNALVTGLEELIRHTMGSATTVRTLLAADLGQVLCDQNQLENALLNLCINARDAMPGGGRLTIVTANTTIDPADPGTADPGAADPEAANLPAGPYVTLDVIDTGCGMTPEVVARVFDPFYTTKPSGQGTGLGLSMIDSFARQSGGRVRITSEPGHGTMMRIYLPLHQGVPEPPAIAARQGAVPPAGSGETILIVDDEPVVRMLISEVLGELGYITMEASNAVAGLNLLQSEARIDLIITDLDLPGGIDGRQMAYTALLRQPGLKILFVTGSARHLAPDQAPLPKNTRVLTKPFTMDVLGSMVGAVIAG